MKKSELTQLTQIIEHLVAREVRKQLPTVISEVFRNMIDNKPVITEKKDPVEKASIKEEIEQDDFKSSLKELFSGVTRTGIKEPEPNVEQPAPRQPKQYMKNPVLNQIMNETAGDLRQREGLVGAAAFQGGYSPIPTVASPVIMEGQESPNAPLSTLPSGVSALDIARQVPLPAPVTKALTRNYSQMMKIIDKKRKGVA